LPPPPPPHLLLVNLNYSSVSAPFHKLSQDQLVVFKLLLDLHQLKQADLPHLKQEDLYHLQRSVMDYHHNRLVHLDHNFNRLEHLDHNNPNRLVLLDHNFKVKDQYFNNPSKYKGQGNHKVLSTLSLLLLNGQGNLKQDHLQVLQSDHPHKDSSNDPNSLEQPEDNQHDLQQDLLVLHQDFQCSTQQPSEVPDFRFVQKLEYNDRGTLQRLPNATR
jgi:hypothetical protein